jgi:pimeloyl-ACP methyl ester carboxylesterase
VHTGSFPTPLGDIAYSSAGTGDDTIVLVHGWGGNRQQWNEVLTELSSGYRLISIDLAGHGESIAATGPYNIQRYASDVAAIAATATGSVTLVGHSMGAPICVEAARLQPDRIAKVIALDALVNKRLYLAQRKSVLLLCRASLTCLYRVLARAITAASFVKPHDPRLRSRIMADMRAVPPRVGRAALCSLLAWDRDAAIHQTAVPVIVIPAAGTYDPADGEALATRCDIGRRLPGGHFSFMEAPKETARFITECLAT